MGLVMNKSESPLLLYAMVKGVTVLGKMDVVWHGEFDCVPSYIDWGVVEGVVVQSQYRRVLELPLDEIKRVEFWDCKYRAPLVELFTYIELRYPQLVFKVY